MTFNIRKGLGASGLNVNLKQIREALRHVTADIVFLQEVMGHSQKSIHAKAGLGGDHLEFLADSVWTHSAYGKNAIYTNGHHGNAILSKFPFDSWTNIDISNSRFEKRGLLHGVIQYHKKNIHIICLHLDLFERGRKVQLTRLIDLIQSMISKNEPLLVAGDFNDWRELATRQLREQLNLSEVGLETNGKHLKTFPAWLPLLPLDRIYFRGLKLNKAQVFNEKKWQNISDHQALIADFIWPS
ncbi:MAG: endonuclease/exonuclease/phosphatase family protein [Bdellovibrionales bacterium]|nr:endonuclease/exonuclease/phosphatase family protein [Bdellovibrionales bacterium]